MEILLPHAVCGWVNVYGGRDPSNRFIGVYESAEAADRAAISGRVAVIYVTGLEGYKHSDRFAVGEDGHGEGGG